MDVNKVMLIGNVSQAPELKTLDGGSQVVRVNMATSHSWKNKKNGDRQEKVNFHTIIGWNRLAENMSKYLKKGDRLYIEGRVDHRSYKNKTGETKYITDIVASKMVMLGSSKKQQTVDETIEVVEETSPDEVPFVD